MGIVLRAYDATLDREVAIKMLSPDAEPDSVTGRRFGEEARIASRLHHPGVIAIYDAGELPDGRPYFTMPFLQGKSLAALLGDRIDVQDRLQHWLSVFERLCLAVAHAHKQGIVHRDLKPGNVMVDEAGEAVVMDWGLAAVNGEPSSASESDYWVFGTPAYMPPEQANGNAAAVPRTDVFGLGAILCEILTGHPPYVGADIASVTRLAVAGDQSDTENRLQESLADSRLLDLVRRCLSTDPNDRPTDAAALASEIAAIRRGRRDRRILKRRLKSLLMAAMALAAATALGAMTARKLQAHSPAMTPVLTPISAPSPALP
jgi:serine/threonine protein kinase